MSWRSPLGLARGLAWALAGLLTVCLMMVLALALFGWNWARAPLQGFVLQKTGRVLAIEGPLSVVLAWPRPRVRAAQVSLANPAWAQAPLLLQADALEASIDLREALRGQLAFPELVLVRPRLFLEQDVDATGRPRKTWLFDKAQSDDSARVPVGQVVLEQAEVSYVDAGQRTRLLLRLHSEPVAAVAGQKASTGGEQAATADPPAAAHRPLVFSAEGQFRGQLLQARGSGGGVLAWRDATRPYPLQLVGRIGATRLQAEGTVTSLLGFKAVNLQLHLSGPDLATLYPLLGVGLLPTPAYRFTGRLQREGAVWRIGPFHGQVGQSDLAGLLELATGGARPLMTGELTSSRLHLADLGPAVGAAPKVEAPRAGARVLPEIPFDTARWASLDADVTLAAKTLIRPAAVPLDRLQLRLQMQDRRLTLDPLNFRLAGGRLSAQVVLDARDKVLRGRLGLQLRDVQLARLLPQVQLRQASLGRLDGDAELSGQGPSVGQLLGSADGRVSVVAQNGLISRLLMEQIGLHLLEVLRLNLGGDETVALHCAVADFGVVKGEMRPRVLLLDTAVSTVTGSGLVSLADERFDLSFVPRTKVSSLVALRSPIYVRGPFRTPAVTLDGGAIAARGLGALALGLVNPLLALVPLFDAGPGQASPCAQLVRDLRLPASPAAASDGQR